MIAWAACFFLVQLPRSVFEVAPKNPYWILEICIEMQALEKRKRSVSQANRQLKKDRASGKWFVFYLA
jgi:hypothetical protein